jgi:hypothetical protein
MGTAANFRSVLRILALSHPWLWELLHPHVPMTGRQQMGGLVRLLDEVALNPQPLPPRSVSGVIQLSARAIADAAIAVHLAGGDVSSLLKEVGDDWCGTAPRGIPWPRHWPHPWPPGEPYPIDPELLLPAVQAEAGLVFQSYASDVNDERLAGAFGVLADRLIETAAAVPIAGRTG